ncbi:lipopolysaccharide-induced tumor necrosis factor-alpha factor homolog [Saccoglossus kowalevskii]|uniref:Lipopolysaccharide-induced tumor necrosis factor-alpha factor homolog n=1 Tax=Saccoglossus kowalevskii TaxID=10224 RepID=A0ABM0MRL8_SACKO|nr:PREDICTED: lipopolysaccharide-induced tumor necrosis factor-alpha factor homolog [Saccoglossus kowalevskii]
MEEFKQDDQPAPLGPPPPYPYQTQDVFTQSGLGGYPQQVPVLTATSTEPEVGPPQYPAQTAPYTCGGHSPIAPPPYSAFTVGGSPYSGRAQCATAIGTQPGGGMMPIAYRDHPVCQQCRSCGQNIVTKIEYQPGMITWVAAGITCMAGAWLGCCLIPFCIPACNDVNHHCPNCNMLLGKYDRLN